MMWKILALLVSAAFLPRSASAQWTWPERSENLQVLPVDLSAQQLRAVMTGFTRALGVRCTHCHVGREGNPLSTYDFASDENPNKDVARAMLNMVGDVNEKLRDIRFTSGNRTSMGCYTCHRGAPRPQTLEEALDEAYAAAGVEASIERYDALRERYYGRGAYDFGETSLNAFGYTLLGRGDIDAAIRMFRKNAELHPESSNVHDSLAEAYLAAGRVELAEIHYRKALELNPENGNVLDKLRGLPAH